MKPEEEYRKKIDLHLEKHFYIEREVWSFCNKFRIDYVLKCKKSNCIFGLEVKSMNRMRGEKFAKYLKQAENYSSLKWKTKSGNIKMLIFISPAISNSFINVKEMFVNPITKKENYISMHESNHEHSNVNSFIGVVFNIGEVRSFKNYLGSYFAFIYRNKTIWSSNYKGGISEYNYNLYQSKL